MLKLFIRSLTDYINNNRQDIRTTLKYSSILTAGIMAMFAYHPALMSIWAYIAAGFDTMLLGFTFAIESTAHVIYEAAAMLGAGIAKVAAYLYASMVALLTVGGEWATAFKQFLSLPLLEMANVSIENIGYFFTGFLLFILTMLSVIVTRKVIKDIKKLYTDDENIDSPFKGISPLTLALLFISLPIIVAASILHHLFSKSEEDNGEDQKQKNG
ncbi:MAG: hypothetical protein LC127_14600 [Chitinophagales bacterium]|nr:hypothetical protein [Chitinophagales bacterium]